MIFWKKGGDVKDWSLKFVGLNSILFLLILYFAFHSLSGDRGLFAFIKLNHEIDAKRANLELLVKKRLDLEKKVKLMHPTTMDKDMLDEMARKELGLMAKDEKVIVLKK